MPHKCHLVCIGHRAWLPGVIAENFLKLTRTQAYFFFLQMNGNLEKMAYRIPELENTCVAFWVRTERGGKNSKSLGTERIIWCYWCLWCKMKIQRNISSPCLYRPHFIQGTVHTPLLLNKPEVHPSSPGLGWIIWNRNEIKSMQIHDSAQYMSLQYDSGTKGEAPYIKSDTHEVCDH